MLVHNVFSLKGFRVRMFKVVIGFREEGSSLKFRS